MGIVHEAVTLAHYLDEPNEESKSDQIETEGDEEVDHGRSLWALVVCNALALDN